MSFSLRQLEIFITVADLDQVTRASEKLLVTQSAVSMSLAELEKQLHGDLFIRRGRNLSLNERGRCFLPLARKIIEQVRDVEKIMLEKR